ncbi:MAG: hypothetical protein AAGF90_20555, partial [Pseudomonadota bacterium]
CERDAFLVHWPTRDVTKGLYLEERFQTEYAPFRIDGGDVCWRGFARLDWIEAATDPRLEAVDWADVTFLYR